MRRHNTHRHVSMRPLRLSSVLTRVMIMMATAAVAANASTSNSGPSLADIQSLGSSVSDSVGLACTTAYDFPISGCTLDELSQGAGCSRDCEKGLETVERTIQLTCNDADVSPNSLLAAALSGHLVRSLCSGSGSGGDASDTTGTMATATMTEQQSSVIIPTLTPEMAPTQSSSSSTSVAASTTEPEPEPLTTSQPQQQTSSTSTPVPLSQTTSASSITSIAVTSSSSSSSSTMSSSSSSSSPSSKTTSTKSKTTSLHNSEPTSTEETGSGSPFDQPVMSAASRPSPWGITVTALAGGSALLFCLVLI